SVIVLIVVHRHGVLPGRDVGEAQLRAITVDVYNGFAVSSGFTVGKARLVVEQRDPRVTGRVSEALDRDDDRADAVECRRRRSAQGSESRKEDDCQHQASGGHVVSPLLRPVTQRLEGGPGIDGYCSGAWPLALLPTDQPPPSAL